MISEKLMRERERGEGERREIMVTKANALHTAMAWRMTLHKN